MQVPTFLLHIRTYHSNIIKNIKITDLVLIPQEKGGIFGGVFKRRLDKSHSRVTIRYVSDFQVWFIILLPAVFDYEKMFDLNIWTEPSVLAVPNTLHFKSIAILQENRDPFKPEGFKT